MDTQAKKAFQNTAILKIMPALYQSGVGFEVRQPSRPDERATLIINGDLTRDIIGLDMDIAVKGEVFANIDITGELRTDYIDTTGGKTIKASSLKMRPSAKITGNGKVDINGNIDGSLVVIQGHRGYLTLACGGNLKCGSIHSGANVTVKGDLVVNDDIGSCFYRLDSTLETNIIANAIVARSIYGARTTVLSNTDLKTNYGIAGGASAYAEKIVCESVGIPEGHGCGTIGRTRVIADELWMNTLPYEADILTVKKPNTTKADFLNLYKKVEGYCWPAEETPSTMTTFGNAQTISPEMIDFIRLANERLNKIFGTQTPSYISAAINKAFNPA